jgi:non-ribosomal peptide synthetase-like protein
MEQNDIIQRTGLSPRIETAKSDITIDIPAELKTYCRTNDFHLLSLLIAAIKFLHYRYRHDERKYEINTLIYSDSFTASDSKGVKLNSNIDDNSDLYKLCRQTNDELKVISFGADFLRAFDAVPYFIGIRLNDPETFDNCSIEFEKLVDNKITICFYADDKHDFSTVFKRSGSHFFNVLSEIVTNDRVLIKDCNYIGQDELKLIHSFSRGSINENIAKPEGLHRIFEQTATKFPENPAILALDKYQSYTEINNKANRLARFLMSKGITNGDCLGILLKRSAEVYISMLAILKSGACYVPLDPGSPHDRIKFILKDCGAKLLITESVFEFADPVIKHIDIRTEKYDNEAYEDTNIENLDFSIEQTAYIIYTSGTTGNPKGVQISHQNISNLVKAEGEHFKVQNTDRVLQGFSVAFDASLEEIWLAFYSGALLVVATDEAMHSGEALTEYLISKDINIFSTVPTMLSMMEPRIPRLKLLILGGEAAGFDLLKRWQVPGLRIVNSYGPTEATVIATYSDFNSAKAVTIGKPIINYSTYLLDQNMHIVPIGIPGEINIGGIGVAKGYLHRPELDKEKFVTVPDEMIFADTHRFYKSGDLGRFTEDGDITFMARIDTQVKLRGFRIELSEIEARIMQCEGVKLAALKVQEGVNKAKRLVAYILENEKGSYNEEKVKEYLRSKLAPYMMPAVFTVVSDIPFLPSGKVDRKRLPDPVVETVYSSANTVPPRTETEKVIHKLWEEYFYPNPVSIHDDFFDLGGYSLLAAMLVSELRKHEGMQGVSVEDIYHNPVLWKFAEKIEERKQKREKFTEKEAIKKVSRVTFTLTAILQAISVILLYGLTAGFLLLLLFMVGYYESDTYTSTLMVLLVGTLVLLPLMMLISIVVKWLVIGRYKEGVYPLWGFYYFRFWFVKKFVDSVPLSLFAGTPFLRLYYQMMGAKIGKGVYMGTDRLRAFDLISIGNNSSISKEAGLLGYIIEDGLLKIGRVTVGEDCFVGVRSLLNINTKMEKHSSLQELSLLSPGNTIPESEIWQGSPARFISKQLSEDHGYNIGLFRYLAYLLAQIIATIIVLAIPLFISLPTIISGYFIFDHYGWNGIAIAIIPVSAFYVISFCLSAVIVKWIFLGKTKEEEFSIYSVKYVRKWLVDTLLHFSLLSLRMMYATIYLPTWLRLLGAKVGRRAEVSTVNQISTDLLYIGKESFLADSVSIGSAEVKRGKMYLKKTSVGSRTFIGNSAVLISGKQVGNNALIGVLSTPPTDVKLKQTDNTSWLGSPPMFLPKRQVAEGFSEQQTFNPPLRMFILRGVIEFFRITLPLAIPTLLIMLFYHYIGIRIGEDSTPKLVLHATLYFAIVSGAMAMIAVAAKWLLIGKYKPMQKPLWSSFVWRNELVNSLCESMAYPYFVNFLLGTPFASFFFRMMGSGIGKRVYMESTEITEFDLVKIKDDVALNFGCTIQTHLFEDRVMKMSYLHIMQDCSVGPMAVVLYNSEMQQAASLSGLSLLMKGEVLPARTHWLGSPARQG